MSEDTQCLIRQRDFLVRENNELKQRVVQLENQLAENPEHEEMLRAFEQGSEFYDKC